VFSAPKHGGTYSRLIVTLSGASGMINRRPPRAFIGRAAAPNFRKGNVPMVELRDANGSLTFENITPDVISTMDEPIKEALLALMKAVEVKDAAIARRAAATRRLGLAITDEETTRLVHEDAESGFSVAQLEHDLGRPLYRYEMAEARQKHFDRVRAAKAREAHQLAINAFTASR
jgi:hypothetical protein